MSFEVHKPYNGVYQFGQIRNNSTGQHRCHIQYHSVTALWELLALDRREGGFVSTEATLWATLRGSLRTLREKNEPPVLQGQPRVTLLLVTYSYNYCCSVSLQSPKPQMVSKAPGQGCFITVSKESTSHGFLFLNAIFGVNCSAICKLRYLYDKLYTNWGVRDLDEEISRFLFSAALRSALSSAVELSWSLRDGLNVKASNSLLLLSIALLFACCQDIRFYEYSADIWAV